MADADSSVSPEKELLKMIENPSAESVSGAEGNPRPPYRPPDLQALMSPETWTNLALKVSEGFKNFFKGENQGVNLRRLILIAKSATVILSCILLLNLGYEIFMTIQPIIPSSKKSSAHLAEAAEEIKPIYSSNIALDPSRRNVFAPGAKKTETGGKSDLSLRLVEMTKVLRLTGISIYPDDLNRTFCMIEDTQKNMTSFLKVNDSILGMKVARIAANGVTLKYQDEEIELR
jgi:hypothetical protein